ncbi:transposase [Demequina lutea]|uniref:Transposase n=1 Tax=Demequina lutea TaxID=431489 RepID=A0A7Y9Z8W6_9MICO|nr:transposase [Demequina lutea]
MSAERTATINALTALLRVVDPGFDARRPLTATQIATITAWRTRDEDLATATARGEATRLAKRVTALDHELKDITKRITDLVRHSPAGTLLDQPGIGPVTAAVALTAWLHLGRIRSEAAFASLAGASPIPASSGNTVRHRINRGGDRRLNRALHMAVVTRMRMDPRAYVERRTTEGRAPSERPAATSSATSPAKSTAASTPLHRTNSPPLDKHRRFNGLIELHCRVARGFRNRDNYRLRMLPIGGRLKRPRFSAAPMRVAALG